MSTISEIIGLLSTRLFVPQAAERLVSAFRKLITRIEALEASSGIVSDGDKGDVTVSASGATWTIDNGVVTPAKASDNLKKGQMTIVFDGGGSAIPVGTKVRGRAPVGGTITKATLVGDPSGSIVIDIWKDTYANFPPTVADTITASAKPTLSSAVKSEDSTLTGWTTTFSAGDNFIANVDSCTTTTNAVLYLDYVRT